MMANASFPCGHCRQTNLDVTFLFTYRKQFAVADDLPADVKADLAQYEAGEVTADKTKTFAAKSWCPTPDCTFNDNVAETLHVKCAEDLGYVVTSCDFGYAFECKCPAD
jgi:hypothetical protein